MANEISSNLIEMSGRPIRKNAYIHVQANHNNISWYLCIVCSAGYHHHS